jgi:hypothetical protein
VKVKENVLKRLINEGCQHVQIDDFSIYFKSIGLEDSDIIQAENGSSLVCVEAVGKLLGGKGGFGALIRAMGKSVENSRNKDACRDLSGRRVRDVETEKKLTEWVKKEAQSSKKDEEEKIKKLEGKLVQPKHMFSDTKYMEQMRSTSETMDDSLKQGLQAAGSSNGAHVRKRHVENGQPSSSKSKKPFLMFGVEEGSDDSESEDEIPVGNQSVQKPSVVEVASTDRSPQTVSTHSSNSDTCGDSEVNHTQSEPGANSDVPVTDKPICTSPPVISSPPLDQLVNTERQGISEAPIQDKPKHMSDQALNSQDSSLPPSDPVSIDLDLYSSVEELASVGPDILKSTLQLLGLKCGGTLQQRAERLYSVKGKPREEWSTSILAKPGKKKK